MSTNPTGVKYNAEKRQIIYNLKPKTYHSSDDEDDIEIVKIDNNHTPTTGLIQWQNLIGDLKITNLNEIADILTDLVKDNPHEQKYSKALSDVQHQLFHQSLTERKKLIVKKDLNVDQFGNRVKMDYDRTVPDEQYRVIEQARDDAKHPKTKVEQKPAPKNFFNPQKKYNPVLMSKKDLAPDDWLK